MTQLQQLPVAGATKRFVVTTKDPCESVPNKVWDSKDIIVELKCDGHRFKLHVFSDKNRLDSRRESSVTGEYVEKTDNAPSIRDMILHDLEGTVFDGELCAGFDSNSVAHALGSHATNDEKQSIYYVAFDLLFLKGKDIRDQPDRVRRKFLELCFQKKSMLNQDIIRLIDRPKMDAEKKRDVLRKAIQNDEEGVMLKDITKPYGKGWTKVKREARYDVVVMGYSDPKQFSKKSGSDTETITKFAAEGFIGALVFGQYVDGKLVEMGQCSGMTDDNRRHVSLNKDSYMNRIFEISAAKRFSTGKFRHPNFKRWRDVGEKLPEDCVYDQEEA